MANLPAVLPPTLQEVVTLARRQVELEGLILDSQNALKDLNEQFLKLSQEDLPNAMFEAGLKELRLDTGELVKVKPDFNCGIPLERKEEAFNWLEEHEFGGMVKTKVIAEFGKGELERAQVLAAALIKKKLNVALAREVHWQTLKAWIVEGARMEIPRKIPTDLFGATPFNKAVVEIPKPPKVGKQQK